MMLLFYYLVTNITLPTNTSSITGLLNWTNTATNNLFGLGFLLAEFIIILIGSSIKGIDIIAAFVVASFLALLTSLAMILMSPPLVSVVMPGVFGGLVMLGIILLLTRGGSQIY